MNDAQRPDGLSAIDVTISRYRTDWKSRGASLEQFLATVDNEHRAAVLRTLLEQEVDTRLRQGQPVRLDEFLSRFPAHSETVLDVFQRLVDTVSIRQAGDLDTADWARQPPPVSTAGRLALPCEFAGYRLEQELGRGGMGVVYRAWQHAAERHVALKCIRTDLLERDDEQDRARLLERFRKEATATAGIEHSAVVPVYEVGEWQGQPYYTMRWIEGESLQELLRSGPLENARAASVLCSVCRGVAAAHRQQVLHRDIKPGNIMLEAETDQTLIMDFGLAKLLETGGVMTRSLEVLGSPPYMAPEQATDSAHVREAADVYGLGATLYHCLAGRPPFQGASPAQTLQQLLHREPLSPRQLNPNVDRDLETICLRCLDKQPQRRYAGAEELAEELQRYLQGQPIVARPLGPLGRGWRWVRRNRSAAALIGTVILATVMLVAGLTVAYRTTSTALSETQRAREDELEAFEESQHHFSIARRAVDQFLRRVANDPRMRAQGMEDLRRSLLSEAEVFYEELLSIDTRNPQLQLERAQSLHSLGIITAATGSRVEALARLQEATTVTQRLLETQPDDPDILLELTSQLLEMVNIHETNNDYDLALRVCQEAVDWSERLLALEQSVENQMQVGDAYASLGRVQVNRFEQEAALAAFAEAAARYRDLEERYPDLVRPSARIAMLDVTRSELFYQQEQREDGRAALVAARDRLTRIMAEPHPDLIGEEHQLGNLSASCSYNLGMFAEAEMDFESAERLYLEARDRWRDLLQTFPLDSDFHARHGAVNLRLGRLWIAPESLEKAEEAIRTAMEEWEYALEKNPEYGMTLELYNAMTTLGLAYQQTELDTAVEWMTAAIDGIEQLTPPDPESFNHSIMYHIYWSDALVGRAQLYEKLGRYQAALQDWDTTIAVHLAKPMRGAEFERAVRIRAMMNQAAVGRVEEARSGIEALLADSPDDGDLLFLAACVYAAGVPHDEAWGATAVDLLRRAQAAGALDEDSRNRAVLESEVFLDAVRDEPTFQQLFP